MINQLSSRTLSDKPVRREDVFTPTSIPTATFVERDSVGEILVEHLRQRGRPICVEGPFRSGKTSLVLTKVQQVFPRYIHFVCQRSSTCDSILLAAFEDPAIAHALETEKKELSRLSANILDVGKDEHQGDSREQGSNSGLGRPQVTSRTLAYYASAAGAALIVDDAHKLVPAELAKLAEAMREWQTLVIKTGFPKLIVIASTHGEAELARQLLVAAPDLRQRLGAINLRLMEDSEISKIIELGSVALNVDFTDILTDIVAYSHGYPGVCHDLCSHACAAAGIDCEQQKPISLRTQDLEKGINTYLRTCEITVRFALRECITNSLPRFPGGFASLALSKTAEGGIPGAALEVVTEALHKTFHIAKEVAMEGLKQLALEDTGVLWVDESSQRVRFIEPIYLVQYKLTIDADTSRLAKEGLVKVFMDVMLGKR